jgi:hypothetical protein
MSWMPDAEPECQQRDASPLVDLVIEPRARNLGGFTVGRVLPSPRRRLVGPFIFFDHMGPAALAAGEGLDVRPHPHIHLATVTYLFEGAVMHRDSLGSAQLIRPGDVNWMNAGRGIAHSERTPPDVRASGGPVHGIQAWVALPRAEEDSEPSFQHQPAASLPVRDEAGARTTLIAGTGFGMVSPVQVLHPTLYAEVLLEPGAVLDIPTEHAERAVYLVDGALSLAPTERSPPERDTRSPGISPWVSGERHDAPRMIVLAADRAVSLCAEHRSHLLVLGGAPVDGPRHIWWNFVSSHPERIEAAKADWQARRFPLVPGDEDEFIPLPAS